MVLCNSFQLNGDPSNIVAQAITQALFDLEPKVDFFAVATEIVENAKARWDNVIAAWSSNRVPGTVAKNAGVYNGTFQNEGLAMTLSITTILDEKAVLPNTQKLRLCINHCDEQTFDLYHYHHDTWTFLPGDRDECIRNGYSGYLFDWNAFMIEFNGFKDDHFDSVSWRLDPDIRVYAQSFHFQF